MTELDLVALGDMCAKLLLAVVFGGAIGYERELNGKFAGLRTHALICLGAALIMHLSHLIASTGQTPGDPARLGAQVVAGIGFLGAGAILVSQGRIVGLTTAATIWVVAAIGLGLGSGFFMESTVTAVLVWVVLVLPAFWERQARRSQAEKEKRPAMPVVKRAGVKRRQFGRGAVRSPAILISTRSSRRKGLGGTVAD